ncbi:MAG: IclR family transcriptional regulator [Lautropia sp.]
MRKPVVDSTHASDIPRAGPQSVGRIFMILDSLASTRAGATLSELARITDSPKSSLVGLLAGLLAEGCLVRDNAGRYLLGVRIHSLAMQALAGRELSELARPILLSLADRTGETAVLSALSADADVVIYLDKVESANAIRYGVTVGERRELYCTAMGKVLLAYFEPARLKKYLEVTPLKKFTPNTITSASRLNAELERIRTEGIGRSDQERIVGAGALAAPIFARDGSVVAALLIAGPAERMKANATKNERLLLRAAAQCTRLAGGSTAS